MAERCLDSTELYVKAWLIEYHGAAHGLPVSEGDRVTRDLLDFLAS